MTQHGFMRVRRTMQYWYTSRSTALAHSGLLIPGMDIPLPVAGRSVRPFLRQRPEVRRTRVARAHPTTLAPEGSEERVGRRGCTLAPGLALRMHCSTQHAIGNPRPHASTLVTCITTVEHVVTRTQSGHGAAGATSASHGCTPPDTSQSTCSASGARNSSRMQVRCRA